VDLRWYLGIVFSCVFVGSGAYGQALDLKGFVFGLTSLEQWSEAVHEERPNVISGAIEVVEPFCSSGISSRPPHLPNRYHFSDRNHAPDSGIESCLEYSPRCVTCISSLARAVTDSNVWTFLDGTLVQMSTTMYRGQLLNNLLAPLFAKYGDPHNIRVDILTNAFGAEFESRHWIWRFPDLHIDVIERAGRADKSSVRFAEPTLAAEMQSRIEANLPDTSNL